MAPILVPVCTAAAHTGHTVVSYTASGYRIINVGICSIHDLCVAMVQLDNTVVIDVCYLG